jgi:hypothetical protein
VDTNTDLGTGEHTLPALQYWDAHQLFHRSLYRADIREGKDIGFDQPGDVLRTAGRVLGANCMRRKTNG